jgi:hypothetical protein
LIAGFGSSPPVFAGMPTQTATEKDGSEKSTRCDIVEGGSTRIVS